MAETINEGYDMPADVNHESRNWWGLSDRHFGMAVIGVCIIGIWYRVCMLFGLNGLTLIFMQGVIVIAVLVVSAAALKLDQWVVRVIRWYFQPYQVMHDDKDVTELSGIIDIEGDHFLSTSGKVCAILQLTAIGNNRVDPEKQETTLACDRDFLNALPCPIQIMGRNFNFDIGAYIAKRLKGSDRLSPKAHALKIDHLNFIQVYIKENEIRDKIELMVIGVDSDRSQPIDELNTNVDIIVANLMTSGVVGRRLYGSEIAAVTIMLCTGVGQSAMDYLSPYMDVEQE
jgi:hypothetical protein